MVNQKMLEVITKQHIEFAIAQKPKKKIGNRMYSFLLDYGSKSGALQYAKRVRFLGYNATVKEHVIPAGDESFIVYNVYVVGKK